MLILTETTDAIEVVLGDVIASTQLQIVASWRDITTTTFTPGRSLQNTNSTTAVDAVTGPAASTQRVIDYLQVFQLDTKVHTVTVKYDANGTEYILWEGELVFGEVLSYVDGVGWSVHAGANSIGYVINVQALTSSPADSATVYFGTLPKAPITTADVSRVYVPKDGRIKRAEIWCYSGTAGTAENWSLYVRLNNTTDTLIQTVGSATNARRFTNAALDIAVVVGDYFEIKGVQPAWATNPATTIYGGYVYIE